MTVTIYPARDRFFSEGLTHLFSGKTPYEELLALLQRSGDGKLMPLFS